MAEIKQKVSLQFETDLQQAREDVTKLGELFEQSTKPTAGQGALSAEQKAGLEGEIGQRATDIGLSPEEVKQVLADINQLKQEARSIDQQNLEIEQENIALKEKAKLAKEDELAALARAATLLKLPANATREEIELARQKLKTSQDLNISEKERKELNAAINQEFRIAQGALKRQNNSLVAQQKNVEIINENTNKQGGLVDRARKFYLKLTKSVEERDTVEGKVTQEIVKQRIELGKNQKAVKAIEDQTKRNEKAEREYGDAIRNTPDSFGGKVTSAFLYFQALTAIKRVAREAVRTITELDKALTDIAVVTTMTRQQTWNLLGTYQDMAKNVGLTTTEVANLSIAFFRQGRSAVDALRLTETAAKFAKIAAIDVNDAANFLTAAINGFNLAASDATRIIDKFAALGAGAAASAQEIAIALSKVAPAAASAGVEIDNLMAFVTKGIETTREAPENIGTAFKTIFARMRELTDIGKTIEDGMDVNRVEASLRSIGVALRDGNGEFRNLDEVLLEVGQRWDSIDRNQQAYLATTLAGTRQQTRLIALFEDFDRTLELIELSQDSAGVAALQHAEYMNGLEAANTRLRTSFQQLITSFVNSEMVIGFINLLNDVLELANTGMGKLVVTAGLLTLGITALSKVQAVNTLVTTMMAAAKLRYNEALISGTLASGAAAKGTNLLSIAKVKLIAVTKALSAAIMAIPLVGWILAAIAALVALAVAFQRVRNSTDTTNIKIARLKVVFDRFIEAVKGFGEAIVGVFENLVSLFNNPAFKTGLRILLAVVTLGVSEVAKASYDLVTQLDEVGEAAASFRVLANQLRESNAQVFTLTKTSNQLNKEIKEFIRLDNIAFKTPAELRQRTEAQNVLKDSMRSTLDTMLEIGDIDRETFSREIAILDSSNTAEAITQQANRILKMQTDELARIQKEQQTAVVNYMNTFEGSFAEAAKSADFADLVEFLPSFAQEVAAAEAELAGLEFSSVQRDAINRAIALDPTAYLDGLNTAKEATNEFYLKTIPELESTLQSALSSSGDDFVKVVQSLQNIDLSLLSENQKALIANLLPNFAIFKNLSEQQLAGVAKAGGAAYLREFQNISKDIGRINFLPTPTTNPTLIANAEKSAQEISEYFFDAFAVSAEEKASVAEALLQEIYSGVVNGVRLNPEQQASLANVVINALGAVDMAGIQRNVLNFMEDLGKIEEILTKPLDRMTAADLAVLQQYPGVLDQVLAGTFDINEFRQQGIAALEKDIDLAEEQLRLALANKQTLRETGQITEQEFEESANILNTNLNLLTVKRQMLRAERINVDAIRQRYKMELDLLNAQRKAIEDAKKMRDLQKDSADIARRSIDATRTGALSTIEAQFNRQQLNAEIADANKALQDNIMMAQLEAQQKILEDSQQKAIEAATEANTIATRENTTAVQSFVSSATRIAGAMTSAASAIVSGLTGNNTVISPIIPNATSTTAPRSTTNSGSQSGAFNDIVGFAEGPT